MIRPPKADVGRADLLRMAARLLPDDVAHAAALLGFREVPAKPVSARSPDRERVKTTEPVTTAPTATTTVSFWRLEEMTFTEDARVEPARPPPPEAKPLDDDDFDSKGRSLFATVRSTPLAPWSRLWPALRSALQASVPGRDPDVQALVRAYCRGEVLRRIPRVVRRVWAGRASVWIDRSPRLVPFWSDQADVCERLLAVCGRDGIDLRFLDAHTQAWAMSRCGDMLAGYRVDLETPVLVLGDLGVYGSSAERAAWRVTARRLTRAGVRVASLVPSSPARWDPATAREWSAVSWERGHRGAAAAARHEPGYWQTRAERLLRLLSPAALVQPGLLRALRLLLPAAEADASTEADVFRHADVRAADVTGLVLHADAAKRWREQFADPNEVSAPLQARVSAAIQRWHEELPRELLRIETLAWIGLIPRELVEPPGDVADALAFAERMEATARLATSSPKIEDQDGARKLAAVRRFERKALSSLPSKVFRAVPALKLAWLSAFDGVDGVPIPEGIDPVALRAQIEAPGEPRWWAVRQVGSDLVLTPSPSAAWSSQEARRGSPVAQLLAAKPDLPVSRGTGLVLSKPPWAVAAGRDRFGLWADADVKGVVVRFRWIPPGSFRLGSPQREAGRYPDEGPQHLVTWTEGRWFADTPVTQALWKAVTGGKISCFEGPDRPVEMVSWEDCQAFCKKLNELAPGLDVRLPSEAEWEYACRAGTERATWAGDLTIQDDRALELEEIAWYHGNSMQGTQPVRGKLPNPWGLYDMLGNVLEWCLDAWNGRTGFDGLHVTDPVPRGRGSGRVIRGGSWSSGARYVRAAFRSASSPSSRYDRLGFRLARGQESSQGAEPGTWSVPPAQDAGCVLGPAAETNLSLKPEMCVRLREGEDVRLRTDNCALTIGVWEQEPWAVAAGRDLYGLWADAEVKGVVVRFRWIPPGRFRIGSPDSEAGRNHWEGPQHIVTWTNGRWLAETPVTQALWEAVMGNNPSHFKGHDRPVESVNWNDCQDFLKTLGALAPGLDARLPSEAEWEYACRAGGETATWVGDLEILGENNAPVLDPIAWYGGNSGQDFELREGHDSSGWPNRQYPHKQAGTHPVAKKSPNPFGLYDMLGNVLEWCLDVWEFGEGYARGDVTDPPPGRTGSLRVSRGGSWLSLARFVRAAYRDAYVPSYRLDRLGFRLARGQGPSQGAEPQGPRSGLGPAPPTGSGRRK